MDLAGLKAGHLAKNRRSVYVIRVSIDSHLQDVQPEERCLLFREGRARKTSAEDRLPPERNGSYECKGHHRN